MPTSFVVVEPAEVGRIIRWRSSRKLFKNCGAVKFYRESQKLESAGAGPDGEVLKGADRIECQPFHEVPL